MNDNLKNDLLNLSEKYPTLKGFLEELLFSDTTYIPYLGIGSEVYIQTKDGVVKGKVTLVEPVINAVDANAPSPYNIINLRVTLPSEDPKGI